MRNPLKNIVHESREFFFRCALAASQCIVIGPVCGWVRVCALVGPVLLAFIFPSYNNRTDRPTNFKPGIHGWTTMTRQYPPGKDPGNVTDGMKKALR